MRSPALNSRPRRAPRGSRPATAGVWRGSVLIVALLVAALIAVVLGSYLNLNLASTRLAKRTFNGYAALNLAEAGAEEAVWSFNRASRDDDSAWEGWSTGGPAAWRKFTRFAFAQNTRGWVKVYVDQTRPPANSQPKIVAQSSIGSPDSTPAVKMIEVTLRRRTHFAGGLVARNRVVFNGANATVDSWHSDPDQDPATAPIPYTPAVRTAQGSVASIAILNTAVSINQANVWGYVATGGGQPQVGSNGTIRGPDTPANVAIDPNRISTDFSADFDPVSAPVDGTPILTVPAVLGLPGVTTKWRTPGIALSGAQTLTIVGDVILVLTTGTAADAISVTGNASIVIAPNSTLTVYAEGGIKIAGKGIANPNAQPVSCTIWSTNNTAAGQQIHLAGNGALKAVVYAPNCDVTLNGNGDIMGAVVARDITLTGNAAFHYDESLLERESNAPFTIAKWRELTSAADRAPYLAKFNF